MKIENENFIPYGTNKILDELIDVIEMSNIEDLKYEIVRLLISNNYGLDKLIKSWDEYVRVEVAKQGYGLDTLIDDDYWEVRKTVADQGYGLDKLVDDTSWRVREAVAKQGYGLDKLVDDDYWWVKKAVAKQGYGLDKLVNDASIEVRETVKDYLEDRNLTLEQWKEQQSIVEDAKEDIEYESRE